MKLNKFKRFFAFSSFSALALISAGGILASNSNSTPISLSSNSSKVTADVIVLNNWKYDITNHKIIEANHPDYVFDVVGNDATLNEIKLVSFTQPNTNDLYSISNLENIRSSNSNDKTKYKVVDVSDRCFLNKTNLQSIILPSEIIQLPDLIFSGCNNLVSVIASSTLTTINYRAFYNCNSLKWFNATTATDPLGKILIPESITAISEESFYGCSSITNIDLPLNLELIEDNAFNNCTSLSSIDIPLSVTAIGATVFNGCTTLAEINVNQNNVALIKLNVSGLFDPQLGGTQDYVIYVPSIEAVKEYEQAVGWSVHVGHYRIGNDSDQSVQLIEPALNLYGIVGTVGTQQYHAVLKPEYLNQNFTWELINYFPNNPQFTSEITIDNSGLLTWSDLLPVGIYTFQIRVLATDYANLMAPHLSDTISLEINNPGDLASSYTDLVTIFISVPIGSIVVALIIYVTYYLRNNHAKWWSKPSK